MQQIFPRILHVFCNAQPLDALIENLFFIVHHLCKGFRDLLLLLLCKKHFFDLNLNV